MRLTNDDLLQLGICGISERLAHRAQITRVDSVEGAQIIGRSGAGDYAGLVYPNIWPGESSPREYRLRRDHPDIEYKDGEPKERNKYLSPPGRGNLLYIPPDISPEWLADSSLPVIFTEGEKKALSLVACAWEGLGDATELPRFLPIGLAGVWAFRGSIGKTTGKDGARRNVTGVIPDIHKLAWKGRRVTVLFDTNVRDNTSVQAARAAFSDELRKLGAVVFWFNWPDSTPIEVNGIDDLIGLWGAPQVRQIISERARPVKVAAEQKSAPREFSRLGDGQYRMAVPSLGIVFTVERVRRERNELTGELAVQCELPGARTTDGSGHIHTANFNFSSAAARRDRAKILLERANADLDWAGLLEELVQHVIRAERQGVPSVTMGDPNPNYRRELMYDIDGLLLLQKHPTIVFGSHSTNKSYIALRALAQLRQMGKRVLYIDWELELEDHTYRLNEMYGRNRPEIEYLRCYRSLGEEVDHIQETVWQKKIDYIVYDSIGYACGGPPESAEVALAYWGHVRRIGLGGLHLAHNSRTDANGKVSDREPFGSRFWTAGARQIWYIGADESTLNPKMVALYCRRNSLDTISKPVAYRIFWSKEDETCDFTRVDIAESQELTAKLPLRDRICQVLSRGPLEIGQISDKLEVEEDTVRKAITRSIAKGKLFIMLPGDSGAKKVGLLG